MIFIIMGYRTLLRCLLLISLIITSVTGCDETAQPVDPCGDSVIDIGEGCDTYNIGTNSCLTEGFYGGTATCNDNCTLNFSDCEGEGTCGDSVLHLEFGEQCDNDKLNNTTCQTLDLGEGVLSCLSSCKFDMSGCDLGAECGDGIIDAMEQCDGDNINDMNCQSLGLGEGELSCNSCEIDISNCSQRPVCGDDNVTLPEECENNFLNGQTCQSIGYYSGDLSCSDNCKFDVSDCILFVCGNGNIDHEDEECDNNSLNGQTCQSIGYDSGQLSCSKNCEFDVSDCFLFVCGNGNIDHANEECDGLNLDSNSCITLGYYGGNLACTDNCILDPTGCIDAGRCDDGVLQEEHETCDGTYLSETCLTLGYSGGSLSCNSNCDGYDISGCSNLPTCVANPGIDPGEECDGTDLGTASCYSLGFMGGDLSCTQGCLYDTSQCWTFTTITAGNDFTCGIDDHDRVWCWGRNESGEVGVGTTSATAFTNPTQIDMGNLNSDEYFTQIDAGLHHICGVTSLNRVWCWGEGNYGQIDGTPSDHNRFSPELILDNNIDGTPYIFQYVNCGFRHNCVITDQGEIYCWGSSETTLGYSNQEYISGLNRPVDFGSFISSAFVDVGVAHSCSLGIDDALWCWGRNAQGQIGNNDATDLAVELPVTITLDNIVQGGISLGNYTSCALTGDGDAYCWGGNDHGMIGDGTITPRLIPTQVSGDHKFADITTGEYNSCAVDFDGKAWCWGEGFYGKLGTGSYQDDSLIPIEVTQSYSIEFVSITMAVNPSHICALTSTGTPWCWGDNGHGQLGTGDFAGSPIPVKTRMP
jgi:alpha-tubulin suppressor-like RCC1 family protein